MSNSMQALVLVCNHICASCMFSFGSLSMYPRSRPPVVQVKKKMNIDEFIRNLRGINKGESLPPDYLRSLYESISRNEIRITTDASDVHLSPIIWVELDQASRSTRGQLLDIDPMGEAPSA